MYKDRGDKSLIDLLKAFQFKKEIFKQSCPDIQQPQHVVRHTKTHIFRQIKTDWRYGILHISRRFDETIDSFDWRTSCR